VPRGSAGSRVVRGHSGAVRCRRACATRSRRSPVGHVHPHARCVRGDENCGVPLAENCGFPWFAGHRRSPPWLMPGVFPREGSPCARGACSGCRFSRSARGEPSSPPPLGFPPPRRLAPGGDRPGGCGGTSACQAGCLAPRGLPFLLFPVPTSAKLEWANACCELRWQRRSRGSVMEAIWKGVRAKNTALPGSACEAAEEFGSSVNLAWGRSPSLLLVSLLVRCHCNSAGALNAVRVHC